MLPRNHFLHHRYRVVRPLGKGGFGQVYEALDDKLDCIVAIKERLADLNSDKLRRAFEREAKLLANLRHSVLPKVTDHFFESSGQYLVMEFIEGDDLATLLKKRKRPFLVDEVLLWADEVLKALEYLHSRPDPIIHRDIKPANIKLADEGEIFLLDFGLAKGAAGSMPVPDTGQRSSSIHAYTAAYAPLEQLNDSGTNGQSDLYSLGATLYHLLTGQVPIRASERYKSLELGQRDPQSPAHEVNPAVPFSVSLSLSQAMAMNRRDRTPSATAMRQVLREARLALEKEHDRAVMETEPPVAYFAGDQHLPHAQSPARSIAPWPTAQPPLVRGVAAPPEVGREPADVPQSPIEDLPKAEESSGQDQSVPTGEGSWPSHLSSENIDLPLASTVVDEQDSTLPPSQVEKERKARQQEERERAERERLERQRLEEETARLKREAEEDAIRQIEEEERLRREQEEQERREAEAAARQLAQQREAERLRVEAEKARQEEEERLRAEAERQRLQEEEERQRQAETEARRQAEERRREAATEERRRAEEEERKRAAEEAHRKEEDRRRAEEETTRRKRVEAEAAARRRAAEEAERRTAELESEKAAQQAQEAEREAASATVAAETKAHVTPAKDVLDKINHQTTLIAEPDIYTPVRKPSEPVPPTGMRRVWLFGLSALLLASIVIFTLVYLRNSSLKERGTTPIPDRTSINGSSSTTSTVPETAHKFSLKQSLSDQKGKVWSVAYSRDGKLVASGGQDGSVRLWDTISWRLMPVVNKHEDEINAVAFSPDSRMIASGSSDKTIVLWRGADKSPPKLLKGSTDKILSVAFSPDGSLLASVGTGTTVTLWDVEAGALKWMLISGHKDEIWSVAFSPDGAVLASAGKDQTISLWDVKKGTKFQSLASSGVIYSLAFSPDGSTLVSGHSDGTIRLWNWKSNESPVELKDHTDKVKSVAFSPDGGTLASASRDKTIKLWNVKAGKRKPEQTLTGHQDSVESVAFSPDGKTLVSGGQDQKVMVWR